MCAALHSIKALVTTVYFDLHPGPLHEANRPYFLHFTENYRKLQGLRKMIRESKQLSQGYTMGTKERDKNKHLPRSQPWYPSAICIVSSRTYDETAAKRGD